MKSGDPMNGRPGTVSSGGKGLNQVSGLAVRSGVGGGGVAGEGPGEGVEVGESVAGTV
jgi:hypothetical protein